ncbi:hypothetical protein VNO80_27386 [Phaseolus coccineus]|uniref:Uncharacterized protein n=1 Tax=Phaseolus coccineus TaxID=3886 RepID=A0AAN9LGB5_PHACN
MNPKFLSFFVLSFESSLVNVNLLIADCDNIQFYFEILIYALATSKKRMKPNLLPLLSLFLTVAIDGLKDLDCGGREDGFELKFGGEGGGGCERRFRKPRILWWRIFFKL